MLNGDRGSALVTLAPHKLITLIVSGEPNSRRAENPNPASLQSEGVPAFDIYTPFTPRYVRR
jgi:hypothetical protein